MYKFQIYVLSEIHSEAFPNSQSVWFPPDSKDSINNSLLLLCIRFSWCLLSLCMKLSCYLRRMCIFSLKSFHIEDIKCFIPCDFAPGLSVPYPSSRLITPQAASPAPIAQTNVFKVVIAVVKNAISVPLENLHFPVLS